jgi:AraC-like DNA-binding protein
MSTSWVYREQQPPDVLAAHVQAIWSELVGARPDDPGARVLPDGCIDLVWIGGRPPFVAGPATGPIITSATPGAVVVGVRFRPGAAASVLGVAADELRDANVELTDLWGSTLPDVLARVEESASAIDRLAAMQALIVERLARGAPPDDLAVMTARWLARHPNDRLDALHDLTGLSERQLRRRFETAVGYGPKTLQRIVRFRRWLRLANRTPADRRVLADLAADAGYADQAHLTREVTRLAGLPPAALLATREARLVRRTTANSLAR